MSREELQLYIFFVLPIEFAHRKKNPQKTFLLFKSKVESEGSASSPTPYSLSVPKGL